MQSRSFVRRNGEQGQTILLVALSLVALLAMAALAIDVVTLYVAHGEAQRAAEAAALAGAKMFVTSGFTSIVTAGAPSVTQADICQGPAPSASAAGDQQAQAAASQNLVAGQPAVIQSINCDFSTPANPRMTVTVQRTGLPTFFARIWRRAASTVTASATAEAFNPSGLSAPVQMQGLKPWLLANCDPTNTAAPTNINCPSGGGRSYFVNPADGSIANNGSFIGQTITLSWATSGGPLNGGDYYALDVPINPPTPACPSTGVVSSCNQVGTNDYRDNVACASQSRISCGQVIPGSLAIGNLQILTGGGLDQRAREGAQCLIHTTGDGLSGEQDTFTSSGAPPVTITGGNNNPNPALRGVTNISRSDSVVTVPLFEGKNFNAGTGRFCSPGGINCLATTTVVGFLQLGITQTQLGGNIQAVILNAAGCNPGAAGNPVSGGGVSPIPVRLIQ